MAAAERVYREDPTRHPMAVAFAAVPMAGLLGVPGWVVVGVASLRSDVAVLKDDV